MQQIEKTKIIRDLWKKSESESEKLKEFLYLLKNGKKIIRRNIREEKSREYFNEFINLCADMEILIDQFRVKYAIEIESVKVSKLRRLNK